MYSGSGLQGILLRIILIRFSCSATGWKEKRMLGRSLSCVRATCRAWSLHLLESGVDIPVDELLWKYLNPPSADYIETVIETDVIKLRTKALQKTVPAGQAVATFQTQDALITFRASPR